MYQLKNSYCDCKSNSSIIPGKIVNQDILISKLIFRAAVRAAIKFFFMTSHIWVLLLTMQ